jgi:hypothetical protein
MIFRKKNMVTTELIFYLLFTYFFVGDALTNAIAANGAPLLTRCESRLQKMCHNWSSLE